MKLQYVCFFLLFLLVTSCSGSSVESYVEEADGLVQEKQRREAILVYQKAIKDHPDEPVLYLNQASLFRKEKMYPNAIRNYTVVKNLNPESKWPYIGLARVYMSQKEYESAKSILVEGLEKLPEEGSILFYLGKLSYEMGFGKEALNYLERAFEGRYKRLDKLYFQRAQVFENLLKDRKRARFDYDSFLKSDPKDESKIRIAKDKMIELNDSRYDF